MSFFQHSDIDLLAGDTIQGEITEIDYEEMSAIVSNVSSARIPIHIHCHDLDIEDDGAKWGSTYPDYMDIGGAGAFLEGDSVYVMSRKAGGFTSGGADELVIIGPVGQGRRCGFYFYLEDEDRNEITDDNFVEFIVANSSQQYISVEWEYISEPKHCWHVYFTDPSETYDEAGYWVRYNYKESESGDYLGNWTQWGGVEYGGKTKESEWWSGSDRIGYGYYEDLIVGEMTYVLVTAAGAWSIFNLDTGEYAVVYDLDGNLLEFPQISSEYRYQDFVNLDQSGNWKTLWIGDTGSGTHEVDDDFLVPVYSSDWRATSTPTYWMLKTIAQGVKEETSPAQEFFSEPISSDLYRKRWIEATEAFGEYISGIFNMEWNDIETFDHCRFLKARNGSDAKLRIATRFEDINYYKRYDSSKRQKLPYPADWSYTIDEDCEFKHYKKRVIKNFYIQPGIFDGLWIIDGESTMYHRYLERKAPWNETMESGNYEKVVKVSSSTSVVEYFLDHPDYNDLIAAMNPCYVMVADINIAFPSEYYSGQNGYFNSNKKDSHYFFTFREDVFVSSNWCYGECYPTFPNSLREDEYSLALQGTDGCAWDLTSEACDDCTTPSDSGEMYNLHNDHRNALDLHELVPNAVIAEVAREHAENMKIGAVPYGHQGFDERESEIRSSLSECISEVGMAENVNRVSDSDPDPIGTCFQEWLDSPGHRANIEYEEATMMGYGSSGEYHVVIFAAYLEECEENLFSHRRTTSVVALVASDEMKEHLKLAMGLEASDPFPWSDYIDERLVPIGTDFLSTYGGSIKDDVLSDGKIRCNGYGLTSIFVIGEYQSDSGETPGIWTVITGMPFGQYPRKLFGSYKKEDENWNKILSYIYVQAYYEYGEECDVYQNPLEMDRRTGLEEAIKETIQAGITRNENSSYIPTPSIYPIKELKNQP